MEKIISLSFFIFIFSFSIVFAATTDNVSGWAWSDNIGWISFNNVTDGSTKNYGVKISTSTGKFSGYAWSDNLGWISFNRSETGAPPSSDPCPDGSCIAKLEDITQIGSSNVRILGWARAILVCPSLPCNTGDNAGGWDGWIRFDHGRLNEVYLDINGNFHGYGWSDNPNVGPLGWISFNCEEGGPNGTNICANSNYKVVLNLTGFNRKPQITATNEDINCCAWGSTPQVAPGLSIRLNWTYSDPDGDPQSAYEIWLDNDSSFSDPKFNHLVESSSANSYTLDLSQDDDHNWLSQLNWNTTYYWKVKVKDERGLWSNWSATDTFTTPSHPFPYVNFNWIPRKPSLGEAIQSCSVSTGTCASIISQAEESKCYDSAGNPVPCSSWNWTFKNAVPSSSNLQNPTTTFTSVGSNAITLTITDSTGFSCSATKTVQTIFPLPKWKEILPASFLEKNFLSSLTETLKFIKIYLTNFFERIKIEIIT